MQDTMKFYGSRNFEDIPQLALLDPERIEEMRVVAEVLPFRTNNYVVDQLIDWTRAPDDPMFQLTFPQRDMLRPDQYKRMARLVRAHAGRSEIESVARQIRNQLNPHPAGQRSANVPLLDGEPVPGLQHKYRETVLIFPSSGQTCHAYCTFCFRWPQFVPTDEIKFATDEARTFLEHIRSHREVTDVLITGGDPMIMTARKLEEYIEPLLGPKFAHVRTIRIGTKSVAYWPYRFVTDKDADDVLGLFERIVAAGKHLSIMGHHSHWVELSTPIARRAIERIRATGAQYRTQSPVVRHVNDDPAVWAKMWQMQVELGCTPYYMFVERNTGAQHHFEVPLARAVEIYRTAIRRVSGLARTARGPSMSALPGKVSIEGIAEVNGERVFVLQFLQARNPSWVKRPFFAEFDPEATWLTDLRPAFGEPRFFYEDELDEILEVGSTHAWRRPGRVRYDEQEAGVA
jgi:KamA family protein